MRLLKIQRQKIIECQNANSDIHHELGSEVNNYNYSEDEDIIKIIKLLIEKGANVNAENKEGTTPLHVAAKKGHAETVKALIE